ncbi:MAG TPA: gephyrin-like molybdotransferase Glp [Aestuariivirga sp.]|jgi:molybdopterin molybdotransferase|nr:gephyrin-like molybdotransferase Glp [Aestuariivirga sp.]
MALLPVEEARARILSNVKPLAPENIPLAQALGRVLAKALSAKRDQPPFNASAMDGYAVRSEDVATERKIIGISAAGHAFKGSLKPGEAVRIFTGAPVPSTADAVVIQENTESNGKAVTVLSPARAQHNIRPRGLDFKKSETLLPASIRLNARDIGLAAAMNCSIVSVRKKPIVAVIATGDELVLPGQKPRADQIVSSNSNALAAMAESFGAEVTNCGIVKDNLKATERAILKMAKADVIVTTGGASVGDHDFIQQALKNIGVKIDFWKIAMRPGKPFMYGRKGKQHVLGLPGNPVSALVCARLFLKPLLNALQDLPVEEAAIQARLGVAMPANDSRQDYIRAKLESAADGTRTATPFNKQDSSMQRTFRDAHCLIIRAPNAPATPAGGLVPILNLDF